MIRYNSAKICNSEKNWIITPLKFYSSPSCVYNLQSNPIINIKCVTMRIVALAGGTLDDDRNRGWWGGARRVGSRVATSIPEGWKRVSVPAGVPRTGRSCCRAIGYSWSPRSKLRDTTKRYRDRRPIDCLAVTSANALVYSPPPFSLSCRSPTRPGRKMLSPYDKSCNEPCELVRTCTHVCVCVCVYLVKRFERDRFFSPLFSPSFFSFFLIFSFLFFASITSFERTRSTGWIVMQKKENELMSRRRVCMVACEPTST